LSHVYSAGSIMAVVLRADPLKQSTSPSPFPPRYPPPACRSPELGRSCDLVAMAPAPEKTQPLASRRSLLCLPFLPRSSSLPQRPIWIRWRCPLGRRRSLKSSQPDAPRERHRLNYPETKPGSPAVAGPCCTRPSFHLPGTMQPHKLEFSSPSRSLRILHYDHL
jgi:hypothetical protein